MILAVVIFTAVRKPGQAIGVTAAFVVGATVNAIYGLLFVEPGGNRRGDPLGGRDRQPNELATILVVALTLALGLAAVLRGSPVLRLLAFAAVAISAAGIFLTGSRGGLVALAVAMLAFLLTGSRFRGRLVLVAITLAFATVGYYNNIASLETRAAHRRRIWERAHGPLGGRVADGRGSAGPRRGSGGNFEAVSPSYLLQPGVIERAELFIGSDPKVAHNSYLEIWAELGAVGLFLFLFILGVRIGLALNVMRAFGRNGDVRMETLSRAVFVAFTAVMAADFFGSRQYDKELWILLGLSAAPLGNRPQAGGEKPLRDLLLLCYHAVSERVRHPLGTTRGLRGSRCIAREPWLCGCHAERGDHRAGERPNGGDHVRRRTPFRLRDRPANPRGCGVQGKCLRPDGLHRERATDVLAGRRAMGGQRSSSRTGSDVLD